MNEDEMREVLRKARDSEQPARSSSFADVWDARKNSSAAHESNIE